MSRRIERTRKGELRLRLPAAERDALRSVPDQLRTLLTQQPEDPSLYRLFPAAYGDDPELEVPMAHKGGTFAVAVHTGIGHGESFAHLPEHLRPHLDLPDVGALAELLRAR